MSESEQIEMARERLEGCALLMRRGQVEWCLEPLGVTERQVRTLLEAGVIRSIVVTPGGRARFSRVEVREKVFEPLVAEIGGGGRRAEGEGLRA